MKKFVALLLGAAMSVTAVAGLSACKKKPVEEPDNGNSVTITRRADPRAADAYEAYDNAGTKIGAYKTIADAINATVNADKDYFEDDNTPDATVGGYVIKKGGTKHLFENRKGFASGNSDTFWYYENGTELTAFNCWDNVLGVTNLQNQKVIAHEVTEMGLSSIQTWNGFGLLDEVGNEITSDKIMPPTWEMSSPMDAGIMMFPTRKVGVSGLHYKLDMSKVTITPAYEGVEDEVYAYIGMYAWQDYYVIGFGVACNTLTGEWYQFRGTSRDNSFSDMDYKVGEKLMDSTWHEEGGYWTPNVKTIEMQAKTVRKIDEFEDKYWEDEVEIKLDDKVIAFSIDDEMVNQYFAGNGCMADNGYVFIAGLDIKNEIVTAPSVANVDYFNGAKFENLAVAEAEIYFPTEEEMTNSEYSIGTIKEDARGQWHDALMANSTFTPGTYDYTMLSNYVCTSYESKDGQDVYHFRFDGSPVSENEIGGQLKVYQDEIDSLKDVTVQTIGEKEELLNKIAGWYGANEAHDNSTIHQQYYLILDFTHFLKAQEIYASSLVLSEEATAILTELQKLSNITAYNYLGWEAPEGTAMAGYLFTELKAFRAQYARFNELTDPLDKKNLPRRFNLSNDWDKWIELDGDIADIHESADWTTLSFTTFGTLMGKTKDGTYTGDEILNQLFYWSYAIKSGRAWATGENDEVGSDRTGASNAGKRLMNFDNNTYPSLRVISFVEFLEKEEIALPGLLQDVLAAIGYESFWNGAWYPLTNMVKLALKIEGGASITDLTEDDMAFLNKVWTKNYSLDAHISYNWINPDGQRFEHYFTDRVARIVFLVSGANEKKMYQYIDKIADFLKGYGYTIRPDMNGWGTTASEISNTPEDSAAAKAVVEAFEALSDISAYNYLGWKTEGESIQGYLYNEIEAFRVVVAAYDALSMNEQLYVNVNIVRAQYLTWLALANDAETFVANAIWEKSYDMLEKPYDPTFEMKTYTAEEALNEMLLAAYKIKAGQAYTDQEEGGVKVIDGDKNFFTSLRLVAFYHFYKVNEVELPGYMMDLLDSVGCDDFYTNFFYPVYYTVQLAQTISTEEYTKVEDLQPEELAFLNEVWTAGYQMKDPLKDHLSSQFKWWSGRVPHLVAIAGGTLAETDLNGYIKIVADFLKGAHYTVNDNGWGVTASAILGVSISEDAVEVIEAFNALSSLAIYNAKGWQAPVGTAMAGYLYSEAKHFEETVKIGFDALTEDEQAIVLQFVGEDAYNTWKAFAPQIVALNANQDFMALSITVMSRSWGGAAVTYNGGEALAEFFMGAQLIGAPTKWGKLGWENDDGNSAGAKIMNADNNWMPSFRIYYILSQLNTVEFEMPGLIETAYNAIKVDAFNTDLDYVFAILTIAKKLEVNPNLKLTQEVVDLVNATMVGKARFAEGGLHYGWADGDFSWRKKEYKTLFGLDNGTTLGTYITNVITYLKSKGAETADRIVGTMGGKMPLGIKAPLTAEADTCQCPNCDKDLCNCTGNCTDGECTCPGCPSQEEPGCECPDCPKDENCKCEGNCSDGNCECDGCKGEEEPGCECPDCPKDENCECEGNCSDGNCECDGCKGEEEPGCECPDCSQDESCTCQGNCSDGNCECDGCKDQGSLECTCDPECNGDDECDCDYCESNKEDCECGKPSVTTPKCTCDGCDNEDGTCDCEENCSNADCEACAGGCTSDPLE